MLNLIQVILQIFGQQPSIKLNSHIAYLPDRAGWYQFQTVKEALDYANMIFTNFNLEKANEYVSSNETRSLMKVENLSKGQQACLYLIFCLARNVRLCILDEPFSGIDLISRERIIQGIIDSIMDSNQTIIISTHEIYESESLFEEVVFLDNGNVKLMGDVEEFRSQGESLETIYRRLYQMNLFLTLVKNDFGIARNYKKHNYFWRKLYLIFALLCGIVIYTILLLI